MDRKKIFKAFVAALICTALFILFHACRYEGQNSSTPISSNTLNINSQFNFETMQNVDISIQIQSVDANPIPHVIKIYDNNPGTTGNLITTGLTDASLLYTTVLRIPATLDSVWVENISVLTDSTVIKVFKQVPVVAKKINYSFTMLSPIVNRKSLGINDPGCSSGCTRTISTRVSSISVGNNEQVCLTSTFNGNIVFNSSTSTAKLVVCGNDTISNITVNGTGTANIIISNSGSLTLRNMSMSKVNITNYGNFNASSGLSILKDRVFTNYGYAQVDVLTIINGTVNNNNTLNVSREIDNSGTLLNQNLLQIAGVLNNSAGFSIENDCRINILGDFQHYGFFTNNGYMVVSGNVQMNIGSKTTLSAQSNLEIASASPTVKGQISVNGNVTGPTIGSGKITVDGRTEILSSATLLNNIDICDAAGIANLQVTLPATVTFCKTFVPATYCTPESGKSPVLDQDNDGVPDILDEFPTDPDRAFTSYYPNINTFATLCFNDLWPSKNIYDGSMNDFVVDFQYKIITNSKNQVVDIYGTFKPRAEGAAIDNAFAVALPVPPSAVQFVSGTKIYGSTASNIIKLAPQGYEAGHLNNTVFSIVNSVYNYYNAHYSINVWPMVDFYQTPEIINTHVQFATPIPSSQLIPPYNPFLIHDSNRSCEVHLIDHPPTELADIKMLGTIDDTSDPSKGLYYHTTSNLPWVIEIPVSFDYPNAKTDIIKAYLRFSDWAQSGGILSKDWYQNKPGYRNTSLIYPKK
jgi:LruC domain-containing protein